MPILTRALLGSPASVGEDNTGTNLGGGAGVFAQKNGVALEFRSIVGTNGIGVVQSATEIAISGALLGEVFYVGASSSTGIISGGRVTVNGGDPSKFDVAAGVAMHVDPNNPTVSPTRVDFGPFIGEDPLDLATTLFTSLAIAPDGGLVKTNVAPDPVSRRTNACIQAVVHVDNANITSIPTEQQPAANVSQALVDYAKKLGSVNEGNQYTAAASDLTISKSAGSTHLPFLNGAFSITNPNEQPNPAQDPVPFFLQSYIDSTQAGGFNLTFQTDVPAGFWDDGSDTLQPVGMNNWAIYWMDFSNNGTALTIGQAEYNTLAAAESALFTENPVTVPAVADIKNTRRTAIIVKGNATDLSNPAQAKFVPISTGVLGGSSSVLSVFDRTGIVLANAGDYSAALVTFTPDGDIAAIEVQAAIVEVRDDTDAKIAALAALGVIQTAKAIGPITNDGAGPETILAEPLQATPLLSGEYRVTAALELKTDTAATWGSGGPDGGATALLTIDGDEVADWFQPFENYTALGCDLLVPFVFGAEPLIDLFTDRVGSGDISARRIAVTLELVNQDLYPLSISNKFVFGVDFTGRVAGTYPDTAELTDAVGPNNCSVSQATVTRQPHIVYLNDIPCGDFDDGLVQFLEGTATENLWDSGETEINLWFSARWRDPSNTDVAVSFGDGLADESGIRVLSNSATELRASVNAGGSSSFVDVTTTPSALQVYRVHYDGSNITVYVNGVSAASTPKTGTLTLDCSEVSLGKKTIPGLVFNGFLGACWLATGTLTAQEIADMDTYMETDNGLTHGVDDFVDIAGAEGAFYITASDRAMEAASPSVKVETLIDRYHNCDPTDTGAAPPDLTRIGGINWVDFLGTTHLVGTAATDLWAGGSTTVVSLFAVASFDDEVSATRHVINAWDQSGAQTIAYIAQVGTDLVFAVRAGGSLLELAVAISGLDIAGDHLYRGLYDGSDMFLFEDGVEIGTTTKTGTWDGPVDQVTMGANHTNGDELAGRVRSAGITTGALTAGQVTNITATLLADAGITP